MTDIKALLLKATTYMQRSDPELAAKLEAAAESLGAPVAWLCITDDGNLVDAVVTDAGRGIYELCGRTIQPLYLAPQPAVPPWRDPYTNNGDHHPDTEYRQGWNACRDAMLYIIEEQGHE